MLMVEGTSSLRIAQNVGVQGLSLWGNPVNDCSFHTFGVVCPGTIHTFLDLPEYINQGV